VTIVLHYARESRAGRVRWLLEELGVPYELRRWTLYSPETAVGGAYRAIHPLGLVPALEIDGRPVIESGAMLVWLADRYPARGLAPGVDAPERAAYLQWIFFTATTLEPPLVDQMFKATDPEVKARGRAQFDAAARIVAAPLADGRPFLLGDQFSAADVSVASVLGWARVLGALESHPALVEYGRRCGGRPAAKAARAD
jgi:glutathione S-transferase